MKIVCVLGSPHQKGNSATLAKRFTDTAEGLGAEIETFALNQLTYRGCQGCYACKAKSESCVLKDDLTPVLDAVHDADVLVMASGVYYGDVTSQLKAFIDRTFSYLVPDFMTNPVPCRLPPGKKLVCVQTQGDEKEEVHDDVFPKYRIFFGYYGMKSYLLRALNVLMPGEIEKSDAVLQEAEDLARKLMA